MCAGVSERPPMSGDLTAITQRRDAPTTGTQRRAVQAEETDSPCEILMENQLQEPGGGGQEAKGLLRVRELGYTGPRFPGQALAVPHPLPPPWGPALSKLRASCPSCITRACGFPLCVFALGWGDCESPGVREWGTLCAQSCCSDVRGWVHGCCIFWRGQAVSWDPEVPEGLQVPENIL